MQPVRFLAAIALALAMGVGCASTNVTNRETLATGQLPRPDQIWVYDFGVTPDDVPAESALADRVDEGPAPSDADLAEGRELGAQVAEILVEKIRGMGLSADHADAETRPHVDDLVIRGYFASIHEGSAAERMVVGFGAGASKLQTVVEGYQMTPQGLRKLGSGTVAAGGGKGPGAALPAAVAVATANPIGLLVTSAVKVEGEASGRSTIEGRAKQTAGEIADQLEARFQQQGWIQ
jgi:hypothetical protein